LNQRHGLHGWPSRGASDPADGSVGTDDTASVNFVLLAALIDLNAKSGSVRRQPQEAGIELKGCASGSRFLGEGADQTGAFDDEVWFFQSNLRGPAVGKELKAANLIQDAGPRVLADLTLEMIGNDQGTWSGFERRLGFENADLAASASKFARYIEARSGASDDDNIPGVPIYSGRCVFVLHRFSLTL